MSLIEPWLSGPSGGGDKAAEPDGTKQSPWLWLAVALGAYIIMKGKK